MDADELLWFDRGKRLGQRLGSHWTADYIRGKIVIQAQNKESNAYVDVMEVSEEVVNDPRDYQWFLDRISQAVENERKVADENVSGF